MDVRVEECSRPEINSNEVLVKVLACGLCTTDVKTIRKGHRYIKPPCVLGHEIAGKIVEIGEDVKGFGEGDPVVVAPYVPCDSCYFCLKGQYSLCSRLFEQFPRPGGFAEFVAVPERIVKKGLIKMDGVKPEEACLTEPLACCIHGVRNLNLKPLDNVLIIGSGPMGLMLLQVAKLFGSSEVIVSDLLDERLDVASRLGADITLNPAKEKVSTRVKDLTGGRGVDKVIVAVGSPEAISQGMSCVRKGGTVLLFGGFPPGTAMEIDPNFVHYDEVNLVGSFGFSPSDFFSAALLIRRGIMRFKEIISEKVGFDRVLEAVKLVSEAKRLKVVVLP
ncbi:MAG: zinc-binding alcohol dehydrogenase [Thermoproteota archaeon]|nr:MAG: zinc-binding alcohol dehydrogenase [Candidatus Korarchaeota archaeon]